jgi:hypothetical protein
MKLRFAYVISVCVGLTLLSSLVPAVATLANGVPRSPSVGTIGSTLSVGPISVSLTSVSTMTCHEVGHPGMQPPQPTRAGWEWLYTGWMLRNPADRAYPLPHPNHPGFRLVGAHRLSPGFYASYPGYSSVVFAHGKDFIPWTFAIRQGTKRVTLTFVPPGPKIVLWSIAVPTLRPTTGKCAASR